MGELGALYSEPAHAPVVNVGDVVDKYRIERVIGVGAMGLVVAARHTTLDQVVAIKFLVAHRFGSAEESVARFLNEARAAARIDSDFVCRVSDVGMLPSGVPYMVMEHLEGNDLEEEIVHRGPLELVEGIDFILQALDAITAAHALGIVHRDLKPANLFLARRPDGSRRVKVLDFGISKAGGTLGAKRLTHETRSLGTPAYMPPEQIREPMGVDHRADIWSLGAILYEVLTGQMAFVGANIKEVLDRVLGEDPCPIPALRPDVPPEVVAIVARALVRDRDHRWHSAAAFARALSYFGSIGVHGTLSNVTKELGSLPSISAVRATPVFLSSSHMLSAGPSPSVEPMVTSHSPQSLAGYASTGWGGERPSFSDLSERRSSIVQDWTARKARERKARGAVLMMFAALVFASAVALLVTRFGAPGLRGKRTEAANVQARGASNVEPHAATLASAAPPTIVIVPPEAASAKTKRR